MLNHSTRRLEALIPYARNSRTHSESQVAQIAASIREFGWTNPILVDGQDNVIAGHGRIAAARVLNLDEVPVVVLDHLSDVQRRALVIADNKIALNAGWDDELLKLELHAIAEADEALLALTGFEGDELSKTMFADPEDEDTDDGDDDVNFSISYNLVFDTEAQQGRWFEFLKHLKRQHGEVDTVAARLDLFLEGAGVGAA